MERAVPTPGSRWLRKNGKHRDAEVEVTESNGLSVFFKNIGGGDRMGNQKVDPSKVHALPYETFLRQYTRGVVGVHTGGPAFRQVNVPKPHMPELRPVVALPADGITTSIEDISPPQAQAWLDRGGHNRPTTRGRVARYARVMARGEWRLNGEAVKLDREGCVIDGKHRLLACVESGATIRSLIIRGLEPEIFTVLDIGKNRTPADVMGIAGYQNRVAVASAARGLVTIDATGRLDPPSRVEIEPLVTHAALLQYVQEHPEVVDGVLLANHVRNGGLSGGSGLLGTLFTLLLRVDRHAAEVFAEALMTGANLDVNNPILRFRNRLITDQRLPNDNATREHLLALGIKAWNFWRAGEEVGQLTWHAERTSGRRGGEAFPVPA
jgi:hypothetical protein